MEIKVKVCGLRQPQNIGQVADLSPDYLGFIFYPQSKRKADFLELKGILPNIKGPKKVGVFVNESPETILNICQNLGLDVVQLHGNEKPEEALWLKERGLQIWKVLGIKPETNWKDLEIWLEVSDAFLFDTPSAQYGGTGIQFDHTLLKDYPFSLPFWLSGGIGPEFKTLPEFIFKLPFLGFDVNSRFELEPGLKNIDSLKEFIQFWRTF